MGKYMICARRVQGTLGRRPNMEAAYAAVCACGQGLRPARFCLSKRLMLFSSPADASGGEGESGYLRGR